MINILDFTINIFSLRYYYGLILWQIYVINIKHLIKINLF